MIRSLRSRAFGTVSRIERTAGAGGKRRVTMIAIDLRWAVRRRRTAVRNASVQSLAPGTFDTATWQWSRVAANGKRHDRLDLARPPAGRRRRLPYTRTSRDHRRQNSPKPARRLCRRLVGCLVGVEKARTRTSGKDPLNRHCRSAAASMRTAKGAIVTADMCTGGEVPRSLLAIDPHAGLRGNPPAGPGIGRGIQVRIGAVRAGRLRHHLG